MSGKKTTFTNSLTYEIEATMPSDTSVQAWALVQESYTKAVNNAITAAVSELNGRFSHFEFRMR